MNGRPLLRATGLVKSFGAVRALDGADFELYPGEIQGLRHGSQGRADAVAFLKSGKKPPALTTPTHVIATKANIAKPDIAKYVYRQKG